MRQVAGADEIQQTESRDHERIGILARRYSGFLDTNWIQKRFSFSFKKPVIKNTQNKNFLEAGTATIAEAQVRLQKLEEFFKNFEEVDWRSWSKRKFLLRKEESWAKQMIWKEQYSNNIYYEVAAIAQEIIR